MRKLVLAGVLAMPWPVAAAEEISSAYTEIRTEQDCVTYEKAGADDGDFANFACAGYRGYPVLMFTGDLRESMYYGFPPANLDGVPWQSFGTFNSTGGRIEWRISSHDGLSVPFATIHRWYVQDEASDAKQIEVLVVAKVGQPGKADGCAVGLVLATGKPNANELARKIADEQARDFACGADERVLVGEPIPEFISVDRTAN
ncbi:hypothetical protein ACFFTN_07625 [Aminobacter aganoensis]|uniref:Secreted protein n=1 Tax=Aminobacter aganoensis TaxID=83264 RepID=A0A7X0F9R3_9HYPH|nr:MULTISPECIES: hypothetical protein [Aminobacter]KQU73106.1 hypothetical protein ASC75_05450 [Aminobacter sp. DSM 101952]MBB6355564.1 hypothetical protein [Aminobacter aganoensis]